jgi:hypothetical protein
VSIIDRAPRTTRRVARRVSVVTVALMAATFVLPSVSSASTVPGQTLAQFEAGIGAAAKMSSLPTQLAVPLRGVPKDTSQAQARGSPQAQARGCLVGTNVTTAIGTRPAECNFGDVSATQTLILYGDSNAWMWLPAFNVIGLADGFRVELDARADCGVADLNLFDSISVAGSKGCSLFRTFVLQQIATVHPFATVIAEYGYYDHLTYANKPYSSQVYLAALERTIRVIHNDGGEPIMLSTPPPQINDPVTCLSQHSTSISQCGTPAECLNANNATLAACTFSSSYPHLSIKNMEGVPSAVVRGGGTYVPLGSLFCTSTTCPPVIDDTVVFFDQAHVSSHFTLRAAHALSQLLSKLVT